MVPPGTYEEMVIMNKKVRLQGWGAPATIINAAKYPGREAATWRNKINQLVAAQGIQPAAGAGASPSTPPTTNPACSTPRRAPASWWWPRQQRAARVQQQPRTPASTASPSPAADHGGGIFVNGYARYLEISNNRIVSNYGTYGGGIRIGHPNLLNPGVVPANDNQYGGYTNADNNNVRIHHNQITAERRRATGRAAACRCTPAATTTR